MKIILISHLFPDETDGFGGISNLSRVKALKRAGNDIIVIKPISLTPPIRYFLPLPNIKKIADTIIKTIKMENKNNYAGFPVYNLKWFPLPKKFLWWEQIYSFNLSVGTKVKSIIKEYRPDAIITVVAHPEGTFARYLKQYCGCPVVSIAEGSEVLVYPKLYRGINKIVDSLNNYSDKVIFVSENMAVNAAAKYHFRNWSIIQNGFESIVFNLSLRDSVRQHKNILSVGSLEYIKGHDLLLEAMKELPGWHLTIVGDGRYEKKYSKYIENNALSDRIRIIKYLSPRELKKYYETSGLFCIPSRSESFGISAIEALACGLPVIASGTGEMKKIIENGVNGFILDELTSLCIEETLIKASKHKWNQEEISNSVKGYSWDRWAKEILKMIDGIIEDKTAGNGTNIIS